MTNYSKKTEYYDKEENESSSKEQNPGRTEMKKTKERSPQINIKSGIKSVKFYVKLLCAVCVLISVTSHV